MKNQNILNFELARQYFVNLNFFQILKLGKHCYFKDKIHALQASHSHQTRFASSGQYNLPMMNFTKCQNSFVYQGLKSWNNLPIALKNLDKLCTFKSQVKKHILS